MLEALRRLFGKKAPEPETPLKPVEPDPSWRPPTKTPEPAPRRSDMIPEAMGPGEKADYPGYSCGTTRIRWVSRERDGNGQPVSVREPQPVTRVMPVGDFTAADRQYTAPRRLAAHPYDSGDGLLWYGDIYGRRVLYAAERFPCFDSSDYLYEDRYYRWFFLWDGEKLTRVQYTDGRDTVTVTVDVRDVENNWWKALQGLACFQ